MGWHMSKGNGSWDEFMMAFRMAANLAYAVTGSATNGRRLWEQYQERLAEARTVDGQEGTPLQHDITTLTDVR